VQLDKEKCKHVAAMYLPHMANQSNTQQMVVVVVVVVMILIVMMIMIIMIWRVVNVVNKECLLYLLPLVLSNHNIQGLITTLGI